MNKRKLNKDNKQVDKIWVFLSINLYFSKFHKISKDYVGKDNSGNSLTTVQLWWKDYSKDQLQTLNSSKKNEEKETLTAVDPKNQWYSVSSSYWQNVESTNDGMLGGFSSISSTDLVGSYSFLSNLIEKKPINESTTARCIGVHLFTKFSFEVINFFKILVQASEE